SIRVRFASASALTLVTRRKSQRSLPGSFSRSLPTRRIASPGLRLAAMPLRSLGLSQRHRDQKNCVAGLEIGRDAFEINPAIAELGNARAAHLRPERVPCEARGNFLDGL